MKDINSLLQLFVSDDDTLSDWACSPFIIDDMVYATDRHSMVIIPGKLAPEVKQLQNYKSENILSVIPKRGPIIQTILTKSILTALKAIPTVREDKECEACKGYGEVEFVFEYEGRGYTTEDDCPLCEGEGSYPDENGKIVPDCSKSITIVQSNFSPKLIKKLYQLCQYFDLQSIDLVHHPDSISASLFSNGEVSFLIMPVKDVESVHTIK